MGISRDSRHKRRATGGKMPIHQKKRKFEMARQPSMTKIGKKSTRLVRGRGANYKIRAMRLEEGNFMWASECISRKTKILDVVYNATSNELVRTKTLMKGCVVQIESAPFKAFFISKYGKNVLPKVEGEKEEEKQMSKSFVKKVAKRDNFIDPQVSEQLSSGKILAKISSRPGQVGRADGYLLEGEELMFYKKKVAKKRGKQQ